MPPISLRKGLPLPQSHKEKLRQFVSGRKYANDPDEREPDDWEPENNVSEGTIERQLRAPANPPPKILTRFQQAVLPVYAQPSDFLFTTTYQLVGGQLPIRIANAQLEGVACQLTILNYGDGAGSGNILIASRSTHLQPSTSGAHQPNACMIEGPPAATQSLPFVLTTKAELWAICVNAVTANVGVILETYDPDSRVWHSWEAGRE